MVKEFSSDPAQAFPGGGQMKPEQLEIERLKREVNKLKAVRLSCLADPISQRQIRGEARRAMALEVALEGSAEQLRSNSDIREF